MSLLYKKMEELKKIVGGTPSLTDRDFSDNLRKEIPSDLKCPPEVMLTPEAEKLHTRVITVTPQDLIDSADKAIRQYYVQQGIDINNNSPQWRCTRIEENPEAKICRVFTVYWQDSLSQDEKKLILKASLRGLTAGDMQAQCLAQQICNTIGIPAPQVYLSPIKISEDNSNIVEIMAEEFITGIPADSLTSKEALSRTCAQLGTYLGKLHSYKIADDLELPAIWSVPDYKAQLREALDYLKGIQALSEKDLQFTENFITKLPEHRTVSLVHNDCHLKNIIVDENGNIKAIIDWAASTLDTSCGELSYLLKSFISEKKRSLQPIEFHKKVPFHGDWSIIESQDDKTQFLKNYISSRGKQEFFSSFQGDLLSEKLRLFVLHASFDIFRDAEMKDCRDRCIKAVSTVIQTILEKEGNQ